MARLQDQNFEHQNVIVGRSAALRPIAPGRGALKIGSKDLKIDDLIEPLKIVALRGNVLQTFVDIKKSRVSDHPTIPSETRKGNHKSTLTAAVFGGGRDYVAVTFDHDMELSKPGLTRFDDILKRDEWARE